jgi:hypothetical protein
MPVERIPGSPLPAAYVPPDSTVYRVVDGDSWATIAARARVDVWQLIEFNFRTRNPAEVNFYLRRNVGCNRPTADGQNWMFSRSASPGLVYLPRPAVTPVPVAIREAPVRVCDGELQGARRTLEQSRETAQTILRPRATSDLPYWFARLYQYITQEEIDSKDQLSFPCFLLHFIPVFYDSYLVAANAFKAGGAVPAHWQDHFTMAGLVVDPSTPLPYANAVAQSLATGVAAHIKGDMAPSLERAYRSFSRKYSGVPPFDTFKPDFFERNREVFNRVRTTLVNELVNRGMGLGMYGRSVDPGFAARAGEIIGFGLDIDEIYRWREEAWRTAKRNLGQ